MAMQPPDPPSRRPSATPKRVVVRAPLARPKVAAVKPKPRQPVRVKSTTPRHPKQPVQPRRPTAHAPRPPPTRAAAATPQAVQPAQTQVAKLERPRQPIANWKPVAPLRPQPAKAASDALKAYLHLILQTLEKHKRYPKYAKRRAMNGHVVLQFVILPDG